jgi:hypothetical protein
MTFTRTLKQLAFASLLVLGFDASQAAAPQKIASVEGVTEYRLDNGLRVLLVPDNSVDSVMVHITYLVGSRHEGYGEKGMAHLLEHMLFKGTPRYPRVKEDFSRQGVRFNGSTSFDRTNYFETLSATTKNLDWAIDVEADRMINAFVRREDLDSEMTVVRNEFESGENNPGSILRQRMMQLAFPWHNYGNPIIGERARTSRTFPSTACVLSIARITSPTTRCFRLAANSTSRRPSRWSPGISAASLSRNASFPTSTRPSRRRMASAAWFYAERATPRWSVPSTACPRAGTRITRQ